MVWYRDIKTFKDENGYEIDGIKYFDFLASKYYGKISKGGNHFWFLGGPHSGGGSGFGGGGFGGFGGGSSGGGGSGGKW